MKLKELKEEYIAREKKAQQHYDELGLEEYTNPNTTDPEMMNQASTELYYMQMFLKDLLKLKEGEE